MLVHKLLEVNTLTHLEQLKTISILLNILRKSGSTLSSWSCLSSLHMWQQSHSAALSLSQLSRTQPEFWSDALHLSAQPLWCTGNSGLLARKRDIAILKQASSFALFVVWASHTNACSLQDIWQHLCFYSAEVTNILILKVSWYCQMSLVCVGGGGWERVRIKSSWELTAKKDTQGISGKESFLAKRSKFSSKIPILVMAKLFLILCAPMCAPWGLMQSCARAIHAKHMLYRSICSPLAFLTGTHPLHPSGIIWTPDVDFQCNKGTSAHTQPAFLQTLSLPFWRIFLYFWLSLHSKGSHQIWVTAQGDSSDNVIDSPPNHCSVVELGLSSLPGNHSLEG